MERSLTSQCANETPPHFERARPARSKRYTYRDVLDFGGPALGSGIVVALDIPTKRLLT